MDKLHQFWSDPVNASELKRLTSDVEFSLGAVVFALKAFCAEPSKVKSELVESCIAGIIESYEAMDISDSAEIRTEDGGKQIAVPEKTFMEGRAIYKTRQGGVRPLRSSKAYATYAADDAVQNLLQLDRVDLWETDGQMLARITDPKEILIDQDQFDTLLKCKLVRGLSEVEGILLEDPKLLSDSPTDLIKRHAKDLDTHNHDYWLRAINKSRALYVGLRRRAED